MKDYFSFVYLDNSNIDDLYPQIFGDVIEKNILHSNEENTNMSIKANIFNILGSNADSKENVLISENVKIVIPTSRKAQLLINYFQNNVLSIQDIIASNQPFEKSVFFVGNAVFFLSDIYNEKTGVSLFNEHENHVNLDDNSVLILETGNTDFIRRHCLDYMDTDDYYAINNNRNAKFGIMMHMSNLKMKKNIRHLTWEIKRAKHFKFYVFGQLVKSSQRFYKIVPFSIWQ